MEPVADAEAVDPGTLNRAERRARRIYGPLPWHFKYERDKSRHTPRIDGEPRRWKVERLRRAAGLESSVGLADELMRFAS